MSAEKLKELNNLKSNIISINQKLLVTDKLITDDNTYVVMPGDTLYSIAKKYNTTVSRIKDLNNLKTDILSINQKLKIPVANNLKNYIVVPGDTLYSIAKRFNTTVDALIIANNLKTNILSIGQDLIIPS